MNWLEQLQSFRDANPDLPEGPDTTAHDDSESTAPKQSGRLDIGIERKGRSGKTATLITGWTLSDEQLLEIAASLKKRLATGGSARGGDILIQGDRRKDVLTLLTHLGYKARII